MGMGEIAAGLIGIVLLVSLGYALVVPRDVVGKRRGGSRVPKVAGAGQPLRSRSSRHCGGRRRAASNGYQKAQ